MYTNRTFEGEDDPSEFEALRVDIPKDVPWCTEALGEQLNMRCKERISISLRGADHSPDAVNLWIGDGRSVTSIHSGMNVSFLP